MASNVIPFSERYRRTRREPKEADASNVIPFFERYRRTRREPKEADERTAEVVELPVKPDDSRDLLPPCDIG